MFSKNRTAANVVYAEPQNKSYFYFVHHIKLNNTKNRNFTKFALEVIYPLPVTDTTKLLGIIITRASKHQKEISYQI